jgi:hypothetical protein
MSYNITTKKESNYLSVQVSGIRTPETILEVAKDIVAACDDYGYNRVLVHVQKMTGHLKTVDVYDLGTGALKGLRRPGRLKMSVVDLEKNRGRFGFFETVVQNQGFNLKFFSDADQAVRWLFET